MRLGHLLLGSDDQRHVLGGALRVASLAGIGIERNHVLVVFKSVLAGAAGVRCLYACCEAFSSAERSAAAGASSSSSSPDEESELESSELALELESESESLAESSSLSKLAFDEASSSSALMTFVAGKSTSSVMAGRRDSGLLPSSFHPLGFYLDVLRLRDVCLRVGCLGNVSGLRSRGVLVDGSQALGIDGAGARAGGPSCGSLEGSGSCHLLARRGAR